MRFARRVLLLLLLMASLVMPGTAHATPIALPQADWENALNAAIDQSGAFATGTTFAFMQMNQDTGESMSVTVRPDGSLHGQRKTPTMTSRIRCVRVDRCWEQSFVTFGDSRWHRMASGSVTYIDARTMWMSSVIGQPLPADAMYATDAMEDGKPIYLTRSGNSDRIRMTGTSINPGELGTMEVIMVGGTRQSTMLTVGAAVTDIPAVRAPGRSAIGEPATQSDPWTAPINRPTG